jgi:histidinol-phosphate phosphatase family protein
MTRKSPKSRPLPVLFLDRDGTLIEEGEYMKHPRQVRVLPGVYRALRELKSKGFRIVVVSNQSGVGRGLITPRQMRSVHQKFESDLRRHKVVLDGFYFCPHHPGRGCGCRKPKPGMLKQAARELNLKWRSAISVGDRPSDVELGQRTGGLGILVKSGYGAAWARSKNKGRPDHVAKDFAAAARWILKNTERI